VSKDAKEQINQLKKTDPNFSYFRVKNAGYLPTAQQFLVANPKCFKEYDYIIISNVDLEIHQDFFLKLQALNSDKLKNAAMVAPKIVTEIGTNKNPKIRVRPTTKNLEIRRFLFSNALAHFALERIHLWKKKWRAHSELSSTSEDYAKIYASHGSFMLFTRRAIDVLLKKQYPIFLFGEELFLAEEFMLEGLATYYHSSLVVHDSEHASTGQLKSANYRRLNFKALEFIISQYFGSNR
jgi:GT2 family glycosyltransferase